MNDKPAYLVKKGFLDFDEGYNKLYVPPKPKKYQPEDNFTRLQNDVTKELAEDFSDSPFADRQ